MMSASSDSRRRARPLLGTFVEITLAGASLAAMDAAADAAFEAVATVHRLMSFHDAMSDVSRLNRAASAQEIRVHPWTFRVLETALDLHRRSRGVFDIAVAPELEALGLLPAAEGLSAQATQVSRRPRSDAIALRPGGRVRFLAPGLRIDLGGIAKGFAVDRAVDVLVAHGMVSGLVNAGGDLAVFGAGCHRVHLRDPRDPRALLGALSLRDGALASSGARFDPFGDAAPPGAAIIDPLRGKPAPSLCAVTVRAPSCMIADALTKVVAIAGEASADLLAECRASALFAGEDGDLRVGSDWREALGHAA